MAGQAGHCWDWGSGAGVLVSVAAVAGGEAGVCAGAVVWAGAAAAFAPGCWVLGGSLGAHAANRSAPISAQTLQKSLIFIFCCSFSSRSRRVRAGAAASERTVKEQPPAFPAPYNSSRCPAEARLRQGCDQVQGKSSYQQSCLSVQFCGCSRVHPRFGVGTVWRGNSASGSWSRLPSLGETQCWRQVWPYGGFRQLERVRGQALGRHERGPDGTGGTWSGWTRSIRHLLRKSTPSRRGMLLGGALRGRSPRTREGRIGPTAQKSEERVKRSEERELQFLLNQR